MSEPTHSDGHGGVHRAVATEVDTVTARPVVAVLVAVVTVFLVAVFWAWRLQRGVEAGFETALDRPTPPAHAYQYEVGLLNQQPFALEERAARTKAEQRAALERLGWADRAKGQVQLPLARGIERVVRGERPGAAP